MGLQQKVLFLLILTITLFSGVIFTIHKRIIFPEYVALEKKLADKELSRCIKSLDHEIESLDALVYDWSAWDDTYQFIYDRNKNYINSNLNNQSLLGIHVSFIFYLLPTLEIAWQKHVVSTDISSLSLQNQESIYQSLKAFLKKLKASQNAKGVLVFRNNIILIASRPIMTSDAKGPINGRLVMGRLLTSKIMTALKNQSGVDFQILLSASKARPRLKIETYHHTGQNCNLKNNKKYLEVSAPYYDVFDHPSLLFQAQIKKEISSKGLEAMWFVFSAVFFAGLLLLLILFFTLQKMFIHPITHFTQHALKNQHSKDLVRYVPLNRTDEIGILIDEFNHMVERLNKKYIDLEARVDQRTSQLFLTEEKYRLVMDAAPNPIVVYDEVGRAQYINPAFTHVFGWTLSELLNQTINYVPEDWEPQLIEMIELLKKGEHLLNWETQRYTKNNQLLDIIINAAVLKNLQGQHIGTVAILQDISKLKKVEYFLQNAHKELEIKVQERTAELEKSVFELKKAKDLAEIATQAKSEFLANMSHEIRTPMNSIVGLTELLLNSTMTGKQKDYLTKIQSASHNLLFLINDILDFSKIEAGKLNLEKTEFVLDDVLSSVADLFAKKATEKGLELIISPPYKSLPLLLGDPLRLQQILVNLVGNAIKFTDTGEIYIDVEVAEENSGGLTLEFSIIDTGIGINKEDTVKLFKPFSQADGSITRKFGGTGLGLVICRRLVSLMQGEIRVESVYGKGSTFYFSARFQTRPMGQKTVLRFSDHICPIGILAVDDNMANLKLIQRFLSEFGAEVYLAENGEKALGLLAKQNACRCKIKLVLMDYNMPVMDGIEASQRIKIQNPHLPIIMMVAFGDENISESIMNIGIDHFINKPITKSVLYYTILNQLDDQCALGHVHQEKKDENMPNNDKIKNAHINVDLNSKESQLAEILKGLYIRLRENDLTAEQFVTPMEKLIPPHLLHKTEQIKLAINEFEFDTAGDVVLELAKRMQIDIIQ